MLFRSPAKGLSYLLPRIWEHRNKKYGKFSWLKIKPYKKADGNVYWKSRYGNERRLYPNQLKRVKRVWEKHNKPMHLEVKA